MKFQIWKTYHLPIFHQLKSAGKTVQTVIHKNGILALAQLKDLSVNFLSLVRTPATGKGLTLKSIGPDVRPSTFEIRKTDDERMVAYGVVYAPDQEDAHGDQADETTIRRAAYEFMREGRLKNIDAEHSFNAEMAFVAESWLVRSGDALFPDEPDGSWAVGIQIGDPDLWRQLKSGELTGISLAGVARTEPEPEDPKHHHYTEKSEPDAPGWFVNWLKSLAGKSPNLEKNMDKTELEQIVRDTVAATLKASGSASSSQPETTESQASPAEDATPGETAISDALAKGFAEIERKIDDKITLALAKGVTETGPDTGTQTEESFV